MVAWRVARSLDTLLAQLNGLAPRRSKLSDGSIGDAAHATRDSDHNPWWGPGVVTARDYTHDPAGGLDCHRLAAALVAAKDPRIKYVIWNRQIIDSRQGCNPWVWMPYNGANPHTKHLHLSVMAAPSADDTRPWSLPGLTPEGGQGTGGADVSDVWARKETAWPGGYTDDKSTPYDLMMFVKRNNVTTWQTNLLMIRLLNDVAALRADVAALKSERDS